MFEVIDGLPLASPGKDRGALYSKLAPKSPGDAGYRAGGDDPRIGGAEIAAALAERSGRKTLEVALKPHGFEPRYRAALATLRGPGGEDIAWPLFGARVWERVSVKYAGLLEGHVVVYVDDEVLGQAIRRGDQTILTSELQVLRQRLDRHAGVTGIEVRDIYATARMPV